MTYDALVERNIKAPRARVFELLSDFGGLKMLAGEAVAECECIGHGAGSLRTVTLADGARVVERLELAHDNSVIVYSMMENDSMPLEKYCAVVTLTDTPDGGTSICYGSNWSPLGAEYDDVSETLEGLYNLLIDGIEKAA